MRFHFAELQNFRLLARRQYLLLNVNTKTATYNRNPCHVSYLENYISWEKYYGGMKIVFYPTWSYTIQEISISFDINKLFCIAQWRKRNICYSENTSTFGIFFTYLKTKMIHEAYITWKIIIFNRKSRCWK